MADTKPWFWDSENKQWTLEGTDGHVAEDAEFGGYEAFYGGKELGTFAFLTRAKEAVEQAAIKDHY